MRLWKTEQGNLITDEQLLRHLSAYGSVSAALEVGDIRLLAESGSTAPVSDEERPQRRRPHAKLATLLRD